MKRTIILAITILAVTQVFGQLSVGVRAGFGSYGVSFEPPSLNINQVNLLEPNFGFVAIFNDKSNAGVQLEINYAVKGWREKEKDCDTIRFKHEITYLEVPLMTHFELGRSKFRIFGFFGPYFAVKQSEKTTNLNYDFIIEHDLYDMYNQKVRKLDFGNKVGLGFRLNMGSRFSALADVRYDLQLAGGQNIFKKQPNGIQTSRLSELSCSLSLIFNIKQQRTEEEKEFYVPKEGMNEDFY
ncbi:MAG: PorT family protein [Salinivirgaceae bacterium]|nr:PorT family protein [Salinivirgaceae bacterium]